MSVIMDGLVRNNKYTHICHENKHDYKQTIIIFAINVIKTIQNMCFVFTASEREKTPKCCYFSFLFTIGIMYRFIYFSI